jgi:hypothetical protein
MRVIKLPGSLHNKKIGLFSIVTEDKNSFKFVEKASSVPKEKFIF